MSAKNSYYKLIRERLENSRSAILSNNAQVAYKLSLKKWKMEVETTSCLVNEGDAWLD